MYCQDCKHWNYAEMMDEYQCWNDKSIHEGEERKDLQKACDKIEPREQTN